MSSPNNDTDSNTQKSEPAPQTPRTTQEMVEDAVELLKGEGEPIRKRAPAVPFAVVFMSYMAILVLTLLAIAFFAGIFNTTNG